MHVRSALLRNLYGEILQHVNWFFVSSSKLVNKIFQDAIKCTITPIYQFGFLVSKETVVLRRWESEKKIGFIKREFMWPYFHPLHSHINLQHPKIPLFPLTKGWRSKCQLSKPFTVAIRPLSTRLIKPNFYSFYLFGCCRYIFLFKTLQGHCHPTGIEVL